MGSITQVKIYSTLENLLISYSTLIDLKKTLQFTLQILKRSLTKSNLHDLKKKKRTTTKLQENTTKVLKTG